MRQTDAELRLWLLLRDRRLAGWKFRRQHPIPPYIVDFYCDEARLVASNSDGQPARRCAGPREGTDPLFSSESRGVAAFARYGTPRCWNRE
jgi:hypothetical protein